MQICESKSIRAGWTARVLGAMYPGENATLELSHPVVGNCIVDVVDGIAHPCAGSISDDAAFDTLAAMPRRSLAMICMHAMVAEVSNG